MRAATVLDERLPSQQEQVETITALHLGTFVPGVDVGASVRAGQELGVIQVLDEHRPVTSPVSGNVMAVFPAKNDLIEFGCKLFQIQITG